MIDMENNILNKEKVADLIELLTCKRYYSECLESVTELKERMQYGATSIEMRFHYLIKKVVGLLMMVLIFVAILVKINWKLQTCFLNISFLIWKLIWNFKLDGWNPVCGINLDIQMMRCRRKVLNRILLNKNIR